MYWRGNCWQHCRCLKILNTYVGVVALEAMACYWMQGGGAEGVQALVAVAVLFDAGGC